MSLPLSQLRVLDFSQFESGPFCTQTFALLGADVIKIEPPTIGERARVMAGSGPDHDSPYFALLNSSKRSLTVDLKSDAGREIVHQLLRTADVMVENFGPGAAERLGIGWESVHEIAPRVVYASVKGFPNGPYADFLAHDQIAQAAGGAIAVTGRPGEAPLRSGPYVADAASGSNLALGIMVALWQREQTGVGQQVEVTLQESVINLTRVALARTIIDGEPAGAVGNRSHLGFAAPSDVLPCAGGGPADYVFVFISVANSKQWDALLEATGLGGLREDSRFATGADRAENQDALCALLAEWTVQHPKQRVMEILGAHGVPVSAVFDPQELMTMEHLRERRTFVEVEHPALGPIVVPTAPFHLSDVEWDVRPAPLHGADTDQLLREELAFDEARIGELRASGVIR